MGIKKASDPVKSDAIMVPSVDNLRNAYYHRLDTSIEPQGLKAEELLKSLNVKQAKELRERLIAYDFSIENGFKLIIAGSGDIFIEVDRDCSVKTYHSIQDLRKRINSVTTYVIYKPNWENKETDK